MSRSNTKKKAKFQKLSRIEKRFFIDYWKSIFPKEEKIDETKIRYFDGEWVFLKGRGGLYFIPDDIAGWKKAEADGLEPMAGTDDVPYRMGMRSAREVKHLPRGLYKKSDLGPVKEKYL